MSLSSSVCRVVKWFCKGTSGFRGSLFMLLVLATASFHSSALLDPLPAVCANVGIFGCLAVPYGSTAHCAWNQLFISSSASLMFHSLLTTSFTSARVSSTQVLPGAPFAGRSATCPCPRGNSRRFLQSEVYTAASPFSSSIWVEASAAAGVDGADPPARAAAFVLRRVPTILP